MTEQEWLHSNDPEPMLKWLNESTELVYGNRCWVIDLILGN